MPKTYLFLFASSFLAVAGQLLFKLGAVPGHWTKLLLSPPLWAGLVCYGCSTALWVYSLTKVQLGTAYAFTTLTFVGVYAMSFLVLKESVTVPKLLALLLIVAGFLILAKWG